MADRADAIASAREHLHSGAFLAELDRRVGYRTESQNPGSGERCAPISWRTCSRHSPRSTSPTRLIESPTRQGSVSAGGLSRGCLAADRAHLWPWRRRRRHGRRMARQSRSVADHDQGRRASMAAAPPTTRASTASISRRLRAVRETRGGKLGFNAKFIIETGEEIGSPDLRQVCEALRERAEGRSVPGLRRAAAFRRSADHFPRLPRRQSASISTSICARAGTIPAIGAACSPIPRRSLRSAIASLVDGKGRMQLDALKPPRDLEPDPRGARRRRRSSRPRTSRRSRQTGARRACRRPSGCLPGIRWKCWRCRPAISRSRPTPFPDARSAVLQLRFVVGTRYEEVIDAVRAHLHAQRLSDGRGQRHAELCRVAHRCRQPLGATGRRIDPADHRQGAGDPAEFRRLAAQRRVRRSAWPADDLGAAFLSRLLAARAGRTHSAAGHAKRRSPSWRGSSGISARRSGRSRYGLHRGGEQ